MNGPFPGEGGGGTAPEPPRRIQLSRARGWRLPRNAVVVARPTRWGNPYIVGRHGTAADCVRLYALLLCGFIVLDESAEFDRRRAVQRHVRDNIHDLRGRSLACWCAPGRPCHADVLLELAAS